MNQNSSAARSKPRPLRERLREVASAQILQAAEQVFGEQGLHAAKMEAIAARAGVAVGTLYHHFEDRHALLAALVANRLRELSDSLEESLASSKGQPFEAQLTSFSVAFLSFCETKAGLVALIAEAEPSPLLRKQKAAAGESVNAGVRELLKRGVQAKKIAAAQVASLAILYRGMLRSAVEDTRNHPQSKRSAGQWAKEISALVLRGAAN